MKGRRCKKIFRPRSLSITSLPKPDSYSSATTSNRSPLTPSPEDIISKICEYYNVSFKELLVTRRVFFTKPRNIAINKASAFKCFRFLILDGILNFLDKRAFFTSLF
ncbi:hypothetical protein BuS5_00652 [Desulfosarcina sp. BuS5]|nr:hypothetical protein BuS5_00652 [Desulfosarcina sp. BuS5]